jgi:3-methyladenine DNA glycosylase/8-oxoguanine DNA glycosylase
LSPHRRGRSDPAVVVDAAGYWRATWTPSGPATQLLTEQDGSVVTREWGPGAAWVRDRVDVLLGSTDDVGAFQPQHPVVERAWRSSGGLRVGATQNVWESLAAAILEQKVTGLESRRSWRSLLVGHGQPAPGPAPDGLTVPPPAAAWAAIPDWEYHRAGVGPERMRTLRRAAAVAESLQRLATDSKRLDAALLSIRGIGAWTSAEVRQRACGDADAVSVGDFHLPKLVGFALTGDPSADDRRMLELLAAYRPHRYRVTRLLEMFGPHPPRRGPRYAPLDHRYR